MNSSAHTTDAAAPAAWVAQLDKRQRAMLAEMGLRVWLPEPAMAQQRSVAAAPGDAAPVAPPATAAAAPAQPDATTEAMDWVALRAAVTACTACGLCRGRTQAVLGSADTQADWMLVGDAPDESEDLQGQPFVGAPGALLDQMLHAVGRSRSGSPAAAAPAYLSHALKCRPATGRNPLPDEVARCEPYLARQVALVQPKVIVALGRFAVQALLHSQEPLGRLRGQPHSYRGVPVIVSYLPAYLLRHPADKGKAWADWCLALETVAGRGPAAADSSGLQAGQVNKIGT